MPYLLVERNWTCSEAVELGKWTETIPQRFDSFNFDATSSGSSEALAAVFLATHPLRHAAVHRLRTGVNRLEGMLRSALNLATTLKDKQRKRRLHEILMDFRTTMQAMEVSKNDLEIQLDEELRSIQDQRVTLDKQEQEARLSMFQHDQKNTVEISRQFENSIRNLTSTDEPSEEFIEQDNTRNLDLESAFAAAGDAPDNYSA